MHENSPPVILSLLFLFGFLVFGTSMVLWVSLAVRIRQGLLLPRPQPRRLPAWGTIDLLFACSLFVVLQLNSFALAKIWHIGNVNGQDGTVDLNVNCWVTLFSCYAILGTTWFIAMRCRIDVDDIGWSLSDWSRDLILGVRAFLLFAPPTYLLMGLLTYLSETPYKHPVMEQAKQNPSLLVPAAIMAVLCAPLAEEFAFRVLFQGKLESMSIGAFSLRKLWFGRAGMVNAPMLSTIDESSEGHVAIDGREGFTSQIPWWPVFVSGTLFGLAHFDYGVSWVPLCFLGYVLGGLYRITNRIWPCLVLHLCFNGFTMLFFSAQVLYGAEVEPPDAASRTVVINTWVP